MNQRSIRALSKKKDESFSDISDVSVIRLIKIDVSSTPYYLVGDNNEKVSIVFKAAQDQGM